MANQDSKLKLSALNPLAATFEPKREESPEHGNANSAMKPLGKSDAPVDASVVESMPLMEFRPFSRMPNELRLKIWKLDMPGARVVEVKYSKKIYHAISPTPAPALLHVCREVSLSCPFTIRAGF